MARGIVACRAETAVAAAARAMSERHTRSVVVVSPHGRPLGVVTGFDLLSYGDGGDPAEAVTKVMHPPLTIRPDASLHTAGEQMLAHRVHQLLVIDPAEPDSLPLGVISTFDLVIEMAPTSRTTA
jgi:CBS domain-containing protein